MFEYSSIQPSGGDTGAPLNLAKRLAIIESFVPVLGRRVADCGCGTGQYVAALASAGADVFGVEFFEDKVKQFQSSFPELAGRVVQGDLEQLPWASNSMDVVLLNEVLEHVPSDRNALSEVLRVLKPGGALVVFSPNRWHPFETHGATLRSSQVVLPHYLPFLPYVPIRLAASFLEFHARNYWPWQLQNLVGSVGFDIQRTGFVWQTFEGISGNQPAIVGRVRPILRWTAKLLEQTPVLCRFGVSQLILARKQMN